MRDLFIYYCSGAREIVKASANYKSVALPSELSVGPEYGLTVSRQAQPAASDFAMYLLSPQGDVFAVAARAGGFEGVWVYSGRAAGREVKQNRPGEEAAEAGYQTTNDSRRRAFGLPPIICPRS